MLWFSASKFGDEGTKFRQQVRRSMAQGWKLGIERAQKPTFASVFVDWGEANG
jgi:ribulose bisphosphate carboxylase small subunit